MTWRNMTQQREAVGATSADTAVLVNNILKQNLGTEKGSEYKYTTQKKYSVCIQ